MEVVFANLKKHVDDLNFKDDSEPKKEEGSPNKIYGGLNTNASIGEASSGWANWATSTLSSALTSSNPTINTNIRSKDQKVEDDRRISRSSNSAAPKIAKLDSPTLKAATFEPASSVYSSNQHTEVSNGWSDDFDFEEDLSPPKSSPKKSPSNPPSPGKAEARPLVLLPTAKPIPDTNDWASWDEKPVDPPSRKVESAKPAPVPPSGRPASNSDGWDTWEDEGDAWGGAVKPVVASQVTLFLYSIDHLII